MKFTRWKLSRSVRKTRPGGAVAGQVPAGLELLERELEGLAEPGACDVRDRLLSHGASLEFTGTVIRAVRLKGGLGTHAIDVAAELIGTAFPVHPSPKRRRDAQQPHLLAFVGPSGAGKTTVLAKLARRLRAAGRRVLVASLDGSVPAELGARLEAGSVEADIDRTELPIRAVRGAGDLERELRSHHGSDVVLLDTPGLSARDASGLDRLAGELDRMANLGTLEVYLVLPATQSRASFALVRKNFARMAPSACIVTKLDETDEPLAVLEETVRSRTRIAFLADGPDIRAGLRRPRPEDFADLALRGRLP